MTRRGSRLRSITLVLAALVGACSASPDPSDGGLDAGPTDGNARDAYVVPRTRAAPLSCPAATGAVRDLLPLARLDADQTRHGLIAIREDTDGAATVRDDDDATGWAPLPGVIATLRIDLGSGVGRPVALDTLTIGTSGPALTDVHVYVLEACGGGVTADFAWDDVSVPLSLAGACGSCVELDVRGGTNSRVHSIVLGSRDDAVVLPRALPDVSTPPPPVAFPESGVIEGFYGPPWSFAERARMIDAMSVLGLGAYLYAPKNDPLHRAEWRMPYDAGAIARFETLASVARARGVAFLFGVSPFLDFHADVEADYAALVGKLRTLLDAGATGVAILADDIDLVGGRADGALGTLHAMVVTRVASELAASHPTATVWFVPTVYDDAILAMTPGGADYLTALRGLPAEVRVLWTGRDTGDTTLVGSDLTDLRARIGRDPVIWDNEWANDAGDALMGHLLLGTYEGRDATLRAATHGIAANPLIEGSLSRLPVALLGAWLARDEIDGAARASAARAETRYAWRTDATTEATLLRLMEAYEGTFTVPVTHRALEAALARVTTAMQSGAAPSADDLALALDVFAGLATLRSDVRNGALDADVGDELELPLTSLSEDGRAGLALLDAITARLGGADGAAAEQAARQHVSTSRHATRFVWDEALLTSTLDAVAAAPAVDRGFRAPAARPLGALACVVGTPLDLAAFAPESEIRAYGLPGASVTSGVVRFVAPHPGRYTAVISARDLASGGVASAVLDLVCLPAR